MLQYSCNAWLGQGVQIALYEYSNERQKRVKPALGLTKYSLKIGKKRIETEIIVQSINDQQDPIFPVVHDMLVPKTVIAKSKDLAASNAGNVLAAAVGLTTGDLDVAPGPVGATTAATDNSNVITAGGDGARTGNAGDSEVGDGDAAGRGTLQVTALVVLLNQDTVPIRSLVGRFSNTKRGVLCSLLGNGGKGDAGVGNALDGAGGALGSLDTDT